ncbi:hypothetical protein LEMLEM_LOCUS15898 [Lemmus lemmus]
MLAFSSGAITSFFPAEPAIISVASTPMLSHTGGTTVDLRESWIPQELKLDLRQKRPAHL